MKKHVPQYGCAWRHDIRKALEQSEKCLQTVVEARELFTHTIDDKDDVRLLAGEKDLHCAIVIMDNIIVKLKCAEIDLSYMREEMITPELEEQLRLEKQTEKI